eukprot:jgi/Mesvir1/12796/Mv22846-RA.1
MAEEEEKLLSKPDEETTNQAPGKSTGKTASGKVILIDPDSPNQADELFPENAEAQEGSANAKLIYWISALYFVSGFMGSAWGRFGAIYYVNVQHFSPEQVGIIEGTMPIVRCIAQPIWGALSDKLRRRKHVALLTSCIGTGLILLLAFPKSIATSFDRVWAINLAVASFSSSGILDAFALDALGPNRSLEYGRMRLFMAISWGVGSLLVALAADRYGFDANFLALAILAVTYNGLLAYHVPSQMASERRLTLQRDIDSDAKSSTGSRTRNTSHSKNSLSGKPSGIGGNGNLSSAGGSTSSNSGRPQLRTLIPVLCNLRAAVFYTEVILMGASIASVERLLFVFLQEPEYGINASTTLCGATVFVSVILEIPIFYYARTLVDRVGMSGMWAAASGSMALRCFLLAHATAANVGPLVLGAEALHGVAFTSFWIAGIERARSITPEEFRTTGMSLFQSAYNGIGISCGAFLGGELMQRRGPEFVYLAVAGIMFVSFVARVGHAAWARMFGGDGVGACKAVALSMQEC